MCVPASGFSFPKAYAGLREPAFRRRPSCARRQGSRRQGLAGRCVRANLRNELRHRPRLHQRASHRVAHEIVHRGLLPETNFGPRGMHVDVDFGRGQFQKQQHNRVHRRRNDVPVRLGDCMLNQPVTDEPPVDEDENRIAVQLLNLGLGDEAVNPHLARIFWGGPFPIVLCLFPPPRRGLRESHVFESLPCGHGDQLVEGLLAKHLIDALAASRHRRRHQHGVRGRMQFKMLIGMRQGVMRDQRCDMGEFGRLRSQEFFAGGNIKEKIADGDRSSQRQSGFLHAGHSPAVDLDHSARRLVCCPGLQAKARHRGD